VGSSFHIENFGCRAARADGEAIANRLQASGCCARQGPEADVVIVNTCSVTAEADRAARAFIRRTHRMNPAARIVATGCYAQRAPDELAGMAGVAAVVGNSHKALAPEIALGVARGMAESATLRGFVSAAKLMAGAGQAPIFADDRFAHSFLEEAQVLPGAQTRPNLKIQEGCGNRCSFCVIPQTRGASRSLPAASVLKQVDGFVAAGGKELVLSGINLGRWGRDLGSAHGEPHTFAELVRAIFAQTELARLRLSSIEPMDWNDELIGLMAEFGGPARSANPFSPRDYVDSGSANPDGHGGRLARHAHLPLQSGSDAVLRRMHRRYRPWHYADKVSALVRAVGPDLTVGADVMVGFPGETDAEFEETLKFVDALPFGYLHLFPFSPRPGTRAWALHAANPVANEAVRERMDALRALGAKKSVEHRRRFMGREMDAITLHTPQELAGRGKTAALTENFIPAELDGSRSANRLVRIRIRGLNAESALAGFLIDQNAAVRAAYAAD
jgi:threonylcarbamoyladenosine tRNA methylthiotransferase MtaB